MPRRKPSSPSTPAERERYWLQHLRSAEVQGGTLAAYARTEQLNVHQLYDWRRLLGKRGLLKPSPGRKRRSNFIAITSPSQPDPAPSTALTVKLAQGAELQFHRPLDPEQLRALLQALGASS